MARRTNRESGGKEPQNRRRAQAETEIVRSLKRVKMTLLMKLLVWFAITALLGVSMVFAPKIDKFLNGNNQNIILVEGQLAVNFLHVGQGDCTLIKLPDGKSMIVDGGNKNTWIAEKILRSIPEMFGNDFEVFDYAILTHTDSDHCGSLGDVLNQFPARTVYRPNVISTSKEWGTDMEPGIAVTQSKDAAIDANQRFWWSGTDNPTAALGKLQAVEKGKKDTAAYYNFVKAAYEPTNKSKLNPGEPKVIMSDGRRANRPEGKALCDISGDVDGDGKKDYFVNFYAPLEPAYAEPNDCSNILTIDYNDKTIMLTGDAEKEAEKNFVTAYTGTDFDVDVLKLGHHGSESSSSEDFLNLVLRQNKTDVYAIISCGNHTTYGHPHPKTLERVKKAGVPENQILRTQNEDGTVKNDIPITVDAEGLHINGQISQRETVATVRWWYIAVGIEGLAVIVLFLVIGYKKAMTDDR